MVMDDNIVLQQGSVTEPDKPHTVSVDISADIVSYALCSCLALQEEIIVFIIILSKNSKVK